MTTPQKVQCRATSKRSGERCRHYCPPYGVVCWLHGGKAPSAVRGAEVRRVEAEARRTLAGVDVEPVEDPIRELLDVVAEARTFKDLLAGALDQGDGQIGAGAAQAYGKALDQLGRLLVDVNRLDLEARLVRLEEVQLEEVARAIRKVFKRNGLHLTDREIGEQLRAVLHRG